MSSWWNSSTARDSVQREMSEALFDQLYWFLRTHQSSQGPFTHFSCVIPIINIGARDAIIRHLEETRMLIQREKWSRFGQINPSQIHFVPHFAINPQVNQSVQNFMPNLPSTSSTGFPQHPPQTLNSSGQPNINQTNLQQQQQQQIHTQPHMQVDRSTTAPVAVQEKEQCTQANQTDENRPSPSLSNLIIEDEQSGEKVAGEVVNTEMHEETSVHPSPTASSSSAAVVDRSIKIPNPPHMSERAIDTSSPPPPPPSSPLTDSCPLPKSSKKTLQYQMYFDLHERLREMKKDSEVETRKTTSPSIEIEINEVEDEGSIGTPTASWVQDQLFDGLADQPPSFQLPTNIKRRKTSKNEPSTCFLHSTGGPSLRQFTHNSNTGEIGSYTCPLRDDAATGVMIGGPNQVDHSVITLPPPSIIIPLTAPVSPPLPVVPELPPPLSITRKSSKNTTTMRGRGQVANRGKPPRTYPKARGRQDQKGSQTFPGTQNVAIRGRNRPSKPQSNRKRKLLDKANT